MPKRAPRGRRPPKPGSLAYLLRRLDPDPNVCGRQFERVCLWYLRNCRSDVARAWLWDEWPGRENRDCGIDLVAELKNGELVAVQAKAHSLRNTIRKNEIDSFLSESSQKRFASRLLIATTDRLSGNARRVIARQEKPVELLLRSRLGGESGSWPRSPKCMAPAPPISLDLRRHQRDALEAIEQALGGGGRGQVVMACGTGKTLVAIRSRERLGARRTLVAVPSLPLLKQTIERWRTHASGSFRRLAVCSDQTVEGREDELRLEPGELGVGVSTDPVEIARFLRIEEELVLFTTYQSSERVAEAFAQGAGGGFDLIVADEAHWAAGPRGPLSTVLDAERIPAASRLFLTATPRVYGEELRAEAEERGHSIASMDDEALFGPVVHRLSFGEAIRLGLLADYRVVVGVVEDAELLDKVRKRALVSPDGSRVTDAATLGAQVVLLRAMSKYRLRRVLTFHNRIRRASEFSRDLPDVEALVPGSLPTSPSHIHGGMSTSRRQALLQELADVRPGHSALISNVRCLAEGIDVPSIDAVAIVDPKCSRPEIIQAVGRALRPDGEGKVATIVVPVFVAPGADPQAALRSSAFEGVWEVLGALRDQDERFAEEVDALRLGLGPAAALEGEIERLHIDLPERIGPEFAAAFKARAVKEVALTPQAQQRLRLAAKRAGDEDFDAGPSNMDALGLQALGRFVDRNGHARVPADHKEQGFGLGAWLKETLDRIEHRHLGVPERYLTEPQAELFASLVRAVDIPFEGHPRLIDRLDPLSSLPGLWAALGEGTTPEGPAGSDPLSAKEFPGDPDAAVDDPYGPSRFGSPWEHWPSCYEELMKQQAPRSHQTKYSAARKALSLLREAQAECEELDWHHRNAFTVGFTDGLTQIGLRGCLIDEVEMKYRGNQGPIAAYVRGWDFAKPRRQDALPRAA